MLDVLEVQDKLKNFSQEQLLREMQMPSGSVPQFLVLSELNRRRTMSQDMEKQKMADQPTVKEEVVAASGMPMPETSMLAQQMAPHTSMAENTGIAAMMPKELPSEEEPMKMSYGGVLNSRAMVMAQPLRSSPPLALPFPPRMQQQRDNLGFNDLGSNIVDRIGEKSQGEVDEFIGEVRDMADERFDLDLTPEPQFDTGGKGFSPLLSSAQQANRGTPISPSMMYRREGGDLKPIPEGNKGLPNLPKDVRNKMGFMQEGGVADVMAPNVEDSKELQTIIIRAARALQGATENPEKDIQLFVEKFGMQALNDLRQRVASGELSFGRDGGIRGMISGEGDGMSDSIEAEIVESTGDPSGSGRPLQVANNEYVVAADVVSDIGNGSSEAGAAKLDRLMKDVRLARHGTTEQPDEKDMMGVMKKAIS